MGGGLQGFHSSTHLSHTQPTHASNFRLEVYMSSMGSAAKSWAVVTPPPYKILITAQFKVTTKSLKSSDFFKVTTK